MWQTRKLHSFMLHVLSEPFGCNLLWRLSIAILMVIVLLDLIGSLVVVL